MAEIVQEVKTSVRKRTPRKPKKSQIPAALVLTIIVVVIGFYLAGLSPKLPIFWMFGLAFGYVLQRSRFCFTAAFRDPWISGSTSVTRAVLVAIGICTLGFTAIKYGAVLNGADIPGMGSVTPIGLPLVLGGIIFGIGMVIAGGCASGTLMRIGEGFLMQLLVLVFFVIGSLWGAHDQGAFWGPTFNANAPRVFLPDLFGWFGALVVQGLIILLLYIAAVKWQEKKGTAE
ncbi:MAG: YeeE/YedE thiosulfate transporter family protein [Zhaonellaceae bacterium]